MKKAGGSLITGAVDLGLPSGMLWAQGDIVKDANGNYSIGNPEDIGCHFSWGNVDGYNNGDGYDFGSDNNGPYSSTPGRALTADIASDDALHNAALACLGSPWDIPSKDDITELINNTDKEKTSINETNGWKFMKKTDHSVYIFIPKAGRGFSTGIYGINQSGYYWSSSYLNYSNSYFLRFENNETPVLSLDSKFWGYCIRPVIKNS